MIYDAYKQKYLCSLAPGDKNPSFKVDWNQNDPQFILVGSQIGHSYVVKVDPSYNVIDIIHDLNQNSAVYGVCWSPNSRDQFAIGCMDGSVRLCSMVK